jgi:nitroreductase
LNPHIPWFGEGKGTKMNAVVCALCLPVALLASPTAADPREELEQALSSFYLAPSEAAFSKFQSAADQCRKDLEDAGNGADILVAVMIARISEKHGWPIAETAFSDKAKEILDGQSELAKYVADESLVDPRKLDVWWASFLCTGDERYLESIFRYAGREIPKEDMGGVLVTQAASWSFKSNCKQHKSVLEFAKKKLQSPEVGNAQSEFLKACIDAAEKTNTEPGVGPDSR